MQEYEDLSAIMLVRSDRSKGVGYSEIQCSKENCLGSDRVHRYLYKSFTSELVNRPVLNKNGFLKVATFSIRK